MFKNPCQVDPPGIEPGPDPCHGSVMPIYYGPLLFFSIEYLMITIKFFLQFFYQKKKPWWGLSTLAWFWRFSRSRLVVRPYRAKNVCMVFPAQKMAKAHPAVRKNPLSATLMRFMMHLCCSRSRANVPSRHGELKHPSAFIDYNVFILLCQAVHKNKQKTVKRFFALYFELRNAI